jgi:AraC family transcriptional regulator, regulatory protein of adaptative response / methylphosphotriester-DNA alkyltransferase methyltransferase
LVRQTTLFRRRTLFAEALTVIEQDYADENLSLGAVARSIATSRRQLQRVFGERNTSFRAELQRVRMSKAAELLQEGETPVSAVARSVGYRQPAQFSKAFRRHHGCPPSEMRGVAERIAA